LKLLLNIVKNHFLPSQGRRRHFGMHLHECVESLVANSLQGSAATVYR